MKFARESSQALLLALAISVVTFSALANGQFLQHQSHLGRLVQSIASPLVLSSSPSIYGGSGEPESEVSSSPSYYSQGAANQHQVASGEPSGLRGQFYEHQRGHHQQHSGLQQSPSQQRGIPQHYYGGGGGGGAGGGHRGYYGAPQADRDQGSAPSNRRKTQQYRMGAYLGPTMDDKEMQGAFNSNDERDDDDGPAGYDSAPGSSGRRAKSASSGSSSYAGDEYSPGYGPSASPSGGGYGESDSPGAGPHSGSSSASPNYDAEDGADEDDEQQLRHTSGPRGGLNRAASQYSQQRGVTSGGPRSAMLAAAANGQMPFGYAAGPVDLTGLLGVGADPNSGYQVYNGDGSYPGQNYYDQQRHGGRNRAASTSNGYPNYNYNNNGYAPNGRRSRQNANSPDNDEHEIDSDED